MNISRSRGAVTITLDPDEPRRRATAVADGQHDSSHAECVVRTGLAKQQVHELAEAFYSAAHGADGEWSAALSHGARRTRTGTALVRRVVDEASDGTARTTTKVVLSTTSVVKG